MKKDHNKVTCEFCGKEINIEEEFAIEALTNDLYICEDCIEQGKVAIDELKNERLEEDMKQEVQIAKKPSEIYDFLNDYVIEQDQAKKVLSVAAYNHYKTIAYNNIDKKDKVELQKSNILLLGPTGVGKTYLVQTLAKVLDVPLAIQDATSLTEAGYVGDDVENCLRKLIEAADYDIEKAEKGIIYIDEIDKLSRKGENPSITRDVSGEGVQQALLKIIEGDDVEVPIKGGRKHPNQAGYKINTSNILFICGGSFEGIEKIVEKRISKDSAIGFGAKKKSNDVDKNDLFQQIKVEDIKKFGLLPELLGRLPVVCTLHDLDENSLVKILTQPKNAITKQYKELFALDNIDLKFDPEALTAIANKAKANETGTRGLRGVIEGVLTECMFNAPNDPTINQIIIDKDCIDKEKSPIIIKEEDKDESRDQNCKTAN